MINKALRGLSDKKSKVEFLKRFSKGRAKLSEVYNPFKNSMKWAEIDKKDVYKSIDGEILTKQEIYEKYKKKRFLVFLVDASLHRDDPIEPDVRVLK